MAFIPLSREALHIMILPCQLNKPSFKTGKVFLPDLVFLIPKKTWRHNTSQKITKVIPRCIFNMSYSKNDV